jgi:hypothetical protein
MEAIIANNQFYLLSQKFIVKRNSYIYDRRRSLQRIKKNYTTFKATQMSSLF